MKTKVILCFFLTACLLVSKIFAQCPPPTVVSPVLYCQNATAVPLSATGTNLMWGSSTPGTAGGTATLTNGTYIDNNWNNRKLNFTTNKSNVTISTVDYYIPAYQAVLGLRIAIYNNAGTVIATSSTTTTTSAGATAIKITNTFNYNIAAAGSYSIGVSNGMGNIGGDNPSYPITEPSGTITITGGASNGIRCFNNIKFPSSASATAPTPATDVAGTFNYTVTQTTGGCTSTPATITVIVTAAPAATISYTGASFCTSQAGTVAVTRTGTAGGVFSAPAGLSINSSTGVITPGLSTTGVYTVSYTMAGSGGCTDQVATTQVTIKASPEVTINKTETCLGSNTGTITATAAGGIGPYTYSLNGAAYQSSGTFTGLAAGSYTLNVQGTTGCITTNVVSITQPANSSDDQNEAGTDSWVAHMYDGTNFNNYVGQFTEPETFNESFGGPTTCFAVESAGNTRSIYTETFSVKFRMNSTKKGLYVTNLGSDDGARFSVDGSMIFNNWVDHSYNVNSAVLMNLNGSSNLLYEYYENVVANQVVFQNFTRLIGNTLANNTSQSICIGNSAAAISGDVFASLPSGISLSGTGYQWVYSTSPGGARTNISGATGAAFTPSTASAPFNTPGTYYVFRVAKLSSTNNIAYIPYVASNESNAAIIIVSGGGQWTGSISTDWAVGGNWCTGVVPTSAVDVTIKASAVRMPDVITTGSCRSLTIEAGATVSTLITGTLNVAGTITNNGTMTNNGTTNFNGTTQQTFSGVTTFNNVSINNAAGIILPYNISTNNLLIASGTLNANNNSMGIRGNWTNNASATAFTGGTGTVSFMGTVPQVINGSFSTRFANLLISSTASTVSLGVNTLVQGNLTVSTGTFDLTSFTANRETAGGILTVANNAFLKIGGTNSFPTNYTTNSLIVASTVEYNGAAQTVSNQSYGNLVLSSAAGAVVKTMPATAMTVVGNFSSLKGAGTAVSYTAAANITVNGNVLIGESTTFNAASYSQTMGANWVNNGTFNGNTGTLIFTGTGASVSGTGLQNFNNLTVAASLVTFSNNAVSLTGNLATTGSGSFNLSTGGTLTMTGASKTISGFGISIDNLVISGSVSTASSLTITGNVTVSGSFITSTPGIITMSGASKTISGAGAKSFWSLYVTGAVTTSVDFVITNALNISGTFSASAGKATFTGLTSLTGKASLYNTIINGTSLQLSSASILGIANTMTINSGILDVTSSTPNTVDFNGTGAQMINAITYNNLRLSNGNTKTASGNLTVNNDITIAASTTFVSGLLKHSIYGNWYNQGTFTAGWGTIEFLGSQNTDLYGATTFNVLTVNNTNASTALMLHANVTANIVNMTMGRMLTGANTITITSDRTGNGIILGNITRTHIMLPFVDYAFEGPNNTIRFASVFGVGSITVSVNPQSIADFPYNASISRLYTINIPSGSYTASLRLHYEDAELNGNNEGSLVLWNYSGSFWLPSGKTGNSTTDNYVEKTGITNLNSRWTCGYTANVAEWNGNISSDWHVADNWTVLQGAPSRPPTIDDVAVVGYASFNNQPTISTAVSVKNIVFGSSKPVSLSMTTGGSLNTGDIVGLWNAGNAAHSLNVNNQTVNIAGNLALSDGTSNHLINLNIGTGNLNIVGSLWQFGSAAVTFTGAGNLSIRDNYQYINGAFTAGTGTVTYNGSVNQNVAPVSYYNLTINKTTSTAFITDSTNVGGNLTITAGTIENAASTVIAGDVNIASGATLDNLSRLRVGGNWNNNGTYTSRATGTNVIFNGSGSQNISATTFHDLEINKPVGSVATITGDVYLKGDLIGTSGTLDIKTFNFNRDNPGGVARISNDGTLIIGANNAPNKFSNYTLGNTSTVIFNGTATQHLMLPGIVYGNIIFRNAGQKILYTPIAVNGDLTIDNGATFSGGSNAITLNGNWINNGTFAPATSTVLCAGTLKTISGNNTFNRLTVSGSYTMLNNNTINELLRITSSGNINGGSGIVTTMNGDLINNGILYTLGTTTFTGNIQQTLSLINAVQTVAVTVNFNGTVPPVLNSTTPPQYGFLNINNTGGVNASVGYDILYGLSVGAGASFNAGASTHNIYGYLTNNGTITSSSTINFLPATATTINMGTNFSSTGRVVFGGAGRMTVAGTPVSLKNVTVSNTHASGVTATSGWTLTNSLTINNGSLFNAGSHTFNVAGIIDNRGAINAGTSIFVLNGTTAQTIYSASAFHNLVVNNNTNPVGLLTDVTVNNNLDFIKGNINTGSFKLVQPNAGTVTNASQATGWVNGNIKKGIAAGANLRVFETGDANYYTPVSLTMQNVSVAGAVTISSVAGDHPLLSQSRINVNKSVNRYWKLTNDGLVLDSCNAAFKHPFSDVDASAATATFGASVYNGSSWDVVETSSSNDTITTSISKNLNGDFAIGEVCNKNTAIAYSAAHYCSSLSSAVTPVLNGTTGGLFTAQAGLSINASTGVINPSASTPGEYRVTYTIASTGDCSEFTSAATVFIDEAPSVTMSYPAGPHCSGGGTVNPVFAGTTGGIFSADKGLYIDPATGAINLGNNQPGEYTITYSINASGGCDAVTYNSTINISAPGTWIGTVSTKWFNAANWLCGVIPSDANNLVFAAGATHYPVIDSATVGLHNLEVLNGASIKVVNATLKVAGSVKNLGIIDAVKGTIEFAGLVPQTIYGGTFFHNDIENVIISNSSDSGVVLASPLNVYGALTYSASGKNFTTNDFLTMKSTAEGTARVGNMTGKTLSGSVMVENFMKARKAWRLLSIPTNGNQSVNQSWQEGASFAAENINPGFGTQISGTGANWQANGFDSYSASLAIKKYNSSTNAWVGVPNTYSTFIKNTEGYMLFVRGDRSISSSSPAVTTTILRTKGPLYVGTQPDINIPAGKTMSVGNPYVSPLDLRKLTKSGIKDFFYVWDPFLGGANAVGGYQVLSADSTGNYVVTPGGGSYGAAGSVSNFIPTGQAFFVEAGASGGSLTFTENAKFEPVPNPSLPSETARIMVNLLTANTDGSTVVADGLLVNFNNSYSNQVDNGDAIKYLNSGENISSFSAAKSLIVERRSLNDAKDTVYMRVSNLKVQQYKLSINASQLSSGGRTGRVIDDFTGISTPLQLNGNTVVDFTVTSAAASYAAGRFKIVFDKLAVLPVKFVSLKAYANSNNTVNIDWQSAEELNTNRFEIERSTDGSTFTKILSTPAKGNNGAAYSLNDAQPLMNVNYYRIKGVENSGEAVYSNIVKVAFANKEAFVNVFPNPVTDGKTSLQINNMPKGSYTVQLVNVSGQVVYSNIFENNSRSSTHTIDLGKTIAAGIYQMLTVDPNGAKHTTEMLIQ